jgi:hypothetical protein
VSYKYNLALGIDEYYVWYTFETEFFLRLTFGTTLEVLDFVPSHLLNSHFDICCAFVDGKTNNSDF